MLDAAAGTDAAAEGFESNRSTSSAIPNASKLSITSLVLVEVEGTVVGAGSHFSGCSTNSKT